MDAAQKNLSDAQDALTRAQNALNNVKSAEDALKAAQDKYNAASQAYAPYAQNIASKKTELDAAQAEYDKAAAAAEEAKQLIANNSSSSGYSSSAGQAYSASASESEILAAILQAEAGNQGYDGKLAVASVIMNRVYSPVFKQNTIRDVVYAKNQFEPTRREMVVRVNGEWVKTGMTVMEYYLANPGAVSQETRNVAAAALSGARYGNMNQLFFMTPAALTYCINHGWPKADKVVDQFTLGGHTFFNVAP